MLCAASRPKESAIQGLAAFLPRTVVTFPSFVPSAYYVLLVYLSPPSPPREVETAVLLVSTKTHQPAVEAAPDVMEHTHFLQAERDGL